MYVNSKTHENSSNHVKQVKEMCITEYIIKYNTYRYICTPKILLQPNFFSPYSRICPSSHPEILMGNLKCKQHNDLRNIHTFNDGDPTFNLGSPDAHYLAMLYRHDSKHLENATEGGDTGFI